MNGCALYVHLNLVCTADNISPFGVSPGIHSMRISDLPVPYYIGLSYSLQFCHISAHVYLSAIIGGKLHASGGFLAR